MAPERGANALDSAPKRSPVCSYGSGVCFCVWFCDRFGNEGCATVEVLVAAAAPD